MIPLPQKIEQLKVRYQGEASLPPSDTLALLSALLEQVESLEKRLTIMGAGHVQLDGRLHAVERLLATLEPKYKDPRG